jgi:hypothetical protein
MIHTYIHIIYPATRLRITDSSLGQATAARTLLISCNSFLTTTSTQEVSHLSFWYIVSFAHQVRNEEGTKDEENDERVRVKKVKVKAPSMLILVLNCELWSCFISRIVNCEWWVNTYLSGTRTKLIWNCLPPCLPGWWVPGCRYQLILQIPITTAGLEKKIGLVIWTYFLSAVKVCNNHSLWAVGCWLSSQFELYTNRRVPYAIVYICVCTRVGMKKPLV